MSHKVELVPSPKCELGEGPHWDEITQSLYFVDIYGKDSVLRYDAKENKTYGASIDGYPVVSFIIPVANSVDHYADRYAVGIGREVGIIHWDGKSPKAQLMHIVFEVETDDKYEHNRFNDGKADPVGRFYGGTMRLECMGDLFERADGSFYKYTKGEGVVRLETGIHVSNGLAWNEPKRKFYYIDSCKFNVRGYDYDPKTGNISEWSYFHKVVPYEWRKRRILLCGFCGIFTANERVVIDFRVNGKSQEWIPDGN